MLDKLAVLVYYTKHYTRYYLCLHISLHLLCVVKIKMEDMLMKSLMNSASLPSREHSCSDCKLASNKLTLGSSENKSSSVSVSILSLMLSSISSLLSCVVSKNSSKNFYYFNFNTVISISYLLLAVISFIIL